MSGTGAFPLLSLCDPKISFKQRHFIFLQMWRFSWTCQVFILEMSTFTFALIGVPKSAGVVQPL